MTAFNLNHRPPSAARFPESSRHPRLQKINLKGRVVVWLFGAECAAANAPIAEATLREIPKAARGLGLQISVLNAGTPREIEAAFATLVRDRADALFVMPDALFISRRVQFAARHGIPTAYSVREDVEASGLMSYGTDVLDMYRQVGSMPVKSSRAQSPPICRSCSPPRSS
jgi:DNA-binding LacI/PurR family transcriptional regulator